MFKEILLFFLICGLTAAKSLSDKDNSQISGRIYGGNLVATATAYPFAVNIYTYILGSGTFGAGTIVTANSIVCSARQLESGIIYEIGYGSHIKSQQILQFAYPQDVIYYPQYNGGLTHNIAIIRLPQDISFNSNTQPVQLARRSSAVVDYFHTVQGTIIGWGGYDADQIFLSSTLRYIAVVGITNAACAAIYGENVVISSSLCTHGYLNTKHNACSGDLGGPLLVQENNVWTLIGVIGFALGCPSDAPTGYASVAFYLNWISQTTGAVVRD